MIGAINEWMEILREFGSFGVVVLVLGWFATPMEKRVQASTDGTRELAQAVREGNEQVARETALLRQLIEQLLRDREATRGA